MPAHPGIPGCNTYVDDLSYSPQHDQDPKCPTCGQKRIHIAEVEIASYAEARRISPDDPAAVEMAIRELRNDPHSPSGCRMPRSRPETSTSSTSADRWPASTKA